MIEILKSAVAAGKESHDGLSADGVELRKVKRNKKGGLDLTYHVSVYDHEREDSTVQVLNLEGRLPYHDDIAQVFRKLSGHLGLICEWFTRDAKGLVALLDDGEYVEGRDTGIGVVVCDQVVMKGSAEKGDEAVMLFGRRRLSTGHVVNFGTPLVKLDANTSDYAEAVKLGIALDELRDECGFYMAGKRQPSPQLELGFEEVE